MKGTASTNNSFSWKVTSKFGRTRDPLHKSANNDISINPPISGLSDTKLGAEHVKPAFPFPFYGHDVSEFYITTHGFLSLAPRLHDYIYKTQYIAPLRIKVGHQPLYRSSARATTNVVTYFSLATS